MKICRICDIFGQFWVGVRLVLQLNDKRRLILGVAPTLLLIGAVSIYWHNSGSRAEPTSLISSASSKVSSPSIFPTTSATSAVASLAQKVATPGLSPAITTAPPTHLQVVTTVKPTVIVPPKAVVPIVTTTTITSSTPLSPVAKFDCSTPGSTSSAAPLLQQVQNPNPTNYQSSSEILLKGTNLAGLTEVLLCPAANTNESMIRLDAQSISGGENQVDVSVTNLLVAGAVYDVRVVANGMISGIVSTDRLYIAMVGEQGGQI